MIKMMSTRWLNFKKGKIRDFNQVKCTKDEVDRLLMKDDEIKNR
jgi:hypothetical protein